MLLAEPDEKGAVVKFSLQFDGSPKTYSYVAVKADTGSWFCTSAEAQGKPWEKMLDWLDKRGGEVVSMEVATGWAKL